MGRPAGSCCTRRWQPLEAVRIKTLRATPTIVRRGAVGLGRDPRPPVGATRCVGPDVGKHKHHRDQGERDPAVVLLKGRCRPTMWTDDTVEGQLQGVLRALRGFRLGDERPRARASCDADREGSRPARPNHGRTRSMRERRARLCRSILRAKNLSWRPLPTTPFHQPADTSPRLEARSCRV